MVSQPTQNDERCQEWCAFLETLRQNPRYLSSLVGAPSIDDLRFSADTAALPPGFVVAAAATFGLNLKTAWGNALLLAILADVVFRPEAPVKKGRPVGTKKWDERRLGNLGLRAAIIEANNPKPSDNDIAGELQNRHSEYQHISQETLRQLIPDARRAHQSKLLMLCLSSDSL